MTFTSRGPSQTRARRNYELVIYNSFYVRFMKLLHLSVPVLSSKVDVPVLYRAPSNFLLCFLLYEVNECNKHSYWKSRERIVISNLIEKIVIPFDVTLQHVQAQHTVRAMASQERSQVWLHFSKLDADNALYNICNATPRFWKGYHMCFLRDTHDSMPTLFPSDRLR